MAKDFTKEAILKEAQCLRSLAAAKGETLMPLSVMNGDIGFKINFLMRETGEVKMRTINKYIYILSRVGVFEQMYKKDLYQFSNREIIEMCDLINANVRNSKASFKKVVNKYLFFAKCKGKTTNYVKINSSSITYAHDSTYISHDEYKVLMSTLEKSQDKALMILLWNGFYSKDLRHIRQITRENFVSKDGKNYIDIEDKSISLSNEEYLVLLKALNSNSAVGATGKRLGKGLPNEPLIKGKRGASLAKAFIYSRFKKSLGNKFASVTIKGLHASGAFNRHKHLLKKDHAEYLKAMRKEEIATITAKNISDYIT